MNSKYFSIKRQRAVSLKARNMANHRWEIDRERRAALARRDPAFSGRQIDHRIVVIWGETQVTETTIYSGDSAREARRKERHALKRPQRP